MFPIFWCFVRRKYVRGKNSFGPICITTIITIIPFVHLSFLCYIVARLFVLLLIYLFSTSFHYIIYLFCFTLLLHYVSFVVSLFIACLSRYSFVYTRIALHLPCQSYVPIVEHCCRCCTARAYAHSRWFRRIWFGIISRYKVNQDLGEGDREGRESANKRGA